MSEKELTARVKIQPFIVGGVKHYRAKREGENDYAFEIEPNENLDQFRWRIMRELGGGCIFLFEKTLDVDSVLAVDCQKNGGMKIEKNPTVSEKENGGDNMRELKHIKERFISDVRKRAIEFYNEMWRKSDELPNEQVQFVLEGLCGSAYRELAEFFGSQHWDYGELREKDGTPIVGVGV